MRTHEGSDQRSLALAKAVVARIVGDPRRAGPAKARATVRRWFEQRPLPAFQEWLEIPGRWWEDIRPVLLNESEEGRRWHPSDPFCGFVRPQEPWDICILNRETH
jgi:hypothetical protein